MKLTVIVPTYNEEQTIVSMLDSLFAVDFHDTELEVIVVDDGSKDMTLNRLRAISYPLLLVSQETNQGKSAAIRQGLKYATGDYVIIQDADMEYDPVDIARLLRHAINHDLPVLYGSRRLRSAEFISSVQPKTIFYFGGVSITWLTNLLYFSLLTDEPTCYKLIQTDLLKKLSLKEERFGFCPEVTSKLLRLGYTIKEIPISYTPRTIEEGKKIRFNDAFEAVYILIKNRFLPTHTLHSNESPD